MRQPLYLPLLSVYGILYIIWTGVIFNLSGRFGRFQGRAIICFPVVMAVTLLVFLVSLIKKLFGLQICRRGRSRLTRYPWVSNTLKEERNFPAM